MAEGKFIKDLSGMVFGRLTVLEFAGCTKHRLSKWKCSCTCGNEVVVISGNLKSGTTTSCGCHRVEVQKITSVTHGMTNTKEYTCWQDVLKRCKRDYGKSKANYTDRGITVHSDFQESFMKFYEEIGTIPPEDEKWMVGRIDNNGDYTYGNLRWETPTQQARNKSLYVNNKTGVGGVSYIEKQNKNSVYRAYSAQYKDLDGKAVVKTFNVNILGKEEAFRQAVEFRTEAIKMLNSLGAGYGESHGSEK